MEAATRTAASELESFSPIDGNQLGSVPTLAPEQVQSVVDDVAEVQPFWAALPLARRSWEGLRRAVVERRTGVGELAGGVTLAEAAWYDAGSFTGMMAWGVVMLVVIVAVDKLIMEPVLKRTRRWRAESTAWTL